MTNPPLPPHLAHTIGPIPGLPDANYPPHLIIRKRHQGPKPTKEYDGIGTSPFGEAPFGGLAE